VLSKVDRKILVALVLIQNFKISVLAKAKVEKVNIAVTYSKQASLVSGSRKELGSSGPWLKLSSRKIYLIAKMSNNPTNTFFKVSSLPEWRRRERGWD
jgi:hypothetical protein